MSKTRNLTVTIPVNLYHKHQLIRINPLPQLNTIKEKKRQFIDYIKNEMFEMTACESETERFDIHKRMFIYILRNIDIACSISNQFTRRIYEKSYRNAQKYEKQDSEFGYTCMAISNYIYDNHLDILN